MRYMTKPFEIEAIQYTGDNLEDITNEFPDLDVDRDQDLFDSTEWFIAVYDYLQQTWVRVNIGDYIIKGMRGEYYPCAEDVFERKYEVIND